MTTGLLLPDPAALTDLQTFVGRAKQIDPGGAVRLAAHGQVLAIYAAALHGGGAPTVLAMRVLALAEPSDVDVTVPVAAMTDRFALIERTLADRPTDRTQVERALIERALGERPQSAQRRAGQVLPIRLALPSMTATGATWAGMVPPRTGWSVEGVLRASDLQEAARAGIEEVAAGTPQIAGAAAVAKLRALVWGRPLPGQAELPAGTAFAAEAYGFLTRSRKGGGRAADEVFDQEADQDAVSLHRAGRWWRLSTVRGHVLARPTVTLT